MPRQKTRARNANTHTAITGGSATSNRRRRSERRQQVASNLATLSQDSNVNATTNNALNISNVSLDPFNQSSGSRPDLPCSGEHQPVRDTTVSDNGQNEFYQPGVQTSNGQSANCQIQAAYSNMQVIDGQNLAAPYWNNSVVTQYSDNGDNSSYGNTFQPYPSQTSTQQSVYQQTPMQQSVYQQIPTQHSVHQRIPTQQFVHQQIPTQHSVHQQIPTQQYVPQQIPTQQSVHQQISTQQSVHQQTPMVPNSYGNEFQPYSIGTGSTDGNIPVNIAHSGTQQTVQATTGTNISNEPQLSDNIQVWIVGSSIVRDAFYRVHSGNFQLPGVDIFWDFQPGMQMHHLSSKMYELLALYKPPQYLVVHCGGNDIGQSPLNETELLAINTLQEIQSATNTRIIWSQILPRLVYRNEINHFKLNKCRRRFNTTLAKHCIQRGGAYIRYPQITEKAYLFRDNVHLSEIGNDIFISNLRHGLYSVLYNNATCFPEERV
ncbi:uncharacterized protein LOC123559724 [Mercenaria mercenaria]|uniref:uncharacterized protein LOC123559724 n=1 Tax=Mercenaria mercenaria TaxID=6596 RepID=UPI00234E4455|nr:uncharacterized protein LOC123559724 [Mercenaria mercenaria]